MRASWLCRPRPRCTHNIMLGPRCSAGSPRPIQSQHRDENSHRCVQLLRGLCLDGQRVSTVPNNAPLRPFAGRGRGNGHTPHTHTHTRLTAPTARATPAAAVRSTATTRTSAPTRRRRSSACSRVALWVAYRGAGRTVALCGSRNVSPLPLKARVPLCAAHTLFELPQLQVNQWGTRRAKEHIRAAC